MTATPTLSRACLCVYSGVGHSQKMVQSRAISQIFRNPDLMLAVFPFFLSLSPQFSLHIVVSHGGVYVLLLAVIFLTYLGGM